VFNTIAVITQLEIESGLKPLFQVRGYKTETLEGSNHICNSCRSRTRRRGGEEERRRGGEEERRSEILILRRTLTIKLNNV
jgi:hypothetical protein